MFINVFTSRICLLFWSQPGHLTDLFIPTPRNFPLLFNANVWGLARGGGWAVLELTDALRVGLYDEYKPGYLLGKLTTFLLVHCH